MKTFIVFKIAIQPFNPELIAGVLWEFDILGLIEEDDAINIYTEDDSKISEVFIKDKLEKLISEKVIESFVVKKELVEDRNWNELWEKSREVIKVTGKIAVKPSFKNYVAGANEIVLTIDPKMSFGTGEHQSTKLALMLLEKYLVPGMKVLDIGTGTGILAIASIKLGAESAVAVDNDERCYTNCRENCVLNSVADKVEVVRGEIKDIDDKTFNLIFANIHKELLIDIAGEIIERLRESGVVILSGLLKENEKDIKNHYEKAGFKHIRTEPMDEWIALVFQKMV